MTCSRCNSPNPDVARFCHRCGDVLADGASRRDHFAAHPGEPVRALALMSTLFPHVSGGRHHVYRAGLAIALLASLVAAAFGVLSVALVCAGVALPTMFLLYLHDHEVWADEPVLAIGVGVVLAGGLGVAVGLLGYSFTDHGLTIGRAAGSLPPLDQILLLSLLVPFVAFLALQVAPILLTGRPSLGHSLDALSFAALGAAAFALGESIVLQHGAFTGAAVTHTSPARDTFIAMTLGFAKPVIYAAAAGLAVMRLRRQDRSYPTGFGEGLALVVAFDAALTLLSGYGERGVVLTFVVSLALAGIGLLRLRAEAHDALVAEAEQAVGVAGDAVTAQHAGDCAHCGLPLLTDSHFCLACGSAVAAMPKQHRRRLVGSGATA